MHDLRLVTRLIGFALLAAVLLPAQAGYSELSGEVRDPSGAVIPKARIVASENGTNIRTATVTTSQGIYLISHLKPGSYSILAEATGFASELRQDIQLSTGDRSRVDFQLKLSPGKAEVKVTAETAILNTETSGLGQIVSNRKIVELPLNGRSFVNLTALSAGVALPPGSAFPRINGGRPRTNEYLFDGISVLQPEPGQVAYLPVIDAIQEFKVQSNSISAEFGRFNGGVVNLTTKSGTNSLHGSGFEFLRNEALNARNYFAPASLPKPKFRRNQFGGTLGGPVIHNRTFFFIDYQGTLQDIAQVRISTVPTALQRQGIFTEPVNGKIPVIYDPATTSANGTGFTRQKFNNNSIPAERIDSVASALLARYPLPNLPGTANNYRRIADENVQQHQFDIRLDHQFAKDDSVYGRVSYFRDDSTPAAPLLGGDGSLTSGVIGNTATRAQSYIAHFTHTFGSNRINDLGFGYSRRSVGRAQLLLAQPPSSEIGLPGLPANSFGNALPTFIISGEQQLGPSANANSSLRTDVTEITDNYSFAFGRHTIKFGADLRWERLDVTQPPSPTGLFRFSNLYTDLPGTTGTGFALASFLLGQVDQFSIDLQQKVIRPRAHIEEYYIQDDWRLARNFTLNAGVRYTLNFPSTEADNQGAVFNLQSQKLEYLGQNGFPRSARKLHKDNFGPRIGFSWAVTPTTVVKSGYGIIWIEQAGITTPFTTPQFPFLQTVTQNSVDSIHPGFVLSQGPSVQPVPPTPDAGLGQGVFAVNWELGSGYAQQWNLGIQRQLASTILLEFGYSGNKVTHLGVPDVNLNQLTIAQLSQGNSLLTKVPNPFLGVVPSWSSIGGPTITNAQLLKPFPEFTNVSQYRNNVGNSSYNALYARFEKRFSRGLSLLASYTWSKLIDDASSVFDASILTGPVANYPVADSFNRRRERDLSNGDIPHVFVTSYTYDFPIGAGHRFGSAGFAGKVLSGWSMSGILTMQSGMPVAVTQATNFNAFAGFGVQRPNLVGDPTLPVGDRTVQEWFNTAAFAVAPQFTLGSASRNPVRGPDYRNFDFALIKNTPIREKVLLQFRGEVFNLANIPQLGQPNAVLGAAGFGSITSAGDPRVVQLAMKLSF